MRSRNATISTAVLLPFILSVAVSPVVDARPPAGATCKPQALKSPNKWPSQVRPDGRAEFIVPVNVVRVFSDEHSAKAIASDGWVRAQLEVANRLFRFSDKDMAHYGPGKPAPCLQFKLQKIYDVHEREVSEVLEREFDTENVFADPGTQNGARRVGTRDLRSLKVTDNTQYLTVYLVWSLKNPDEITNEIGGESNVGFADRPPTGPRRVLTKVTATRARMGVMCQRMAGAWMNTFAHEFGHYFGLFHAWVRDKNRQYNITDLGDGPQGKVDPDPHYANVMDYDNGGNVYQYFAKSQMKFMHRFAGTRGREVIQIIRNSGGSGGDTGGRPVVVGKTPRAQIERIWVGPTQPGGPVTVHTRFRVDHLADQGGQVVAWFSMADGRMLRDFDGAYRSSNGQVSMGGTMRPAHESTSFGDYKLTLPAGQLHMLPGTHSLSVVMGIFFGGKLLAYSNPVGFRYAVHAAPTNVQQGGTAAAWITGATVTPSVSHENTQWVRLNASVVLDNLVGKDVRLQARFYFADGTPLRDFDTHYRASDGLVMSENKVTPKYPRTQVPDMQVWIPIQQLHLSPGRHQLMGSLTVWSAGRALASRSTQVFSVGGTSGVPALRASAAVQNTWVTHNQRVGRQLGLLVHSRLTISGMQNRPVSVVAWFWSANGQILRDFDRTYAAANGQVSASINVTPKFPVANFPDCAIFIPYDQLHLARGTHNLTVKVGVFSGATCLGQQATMSPFQVTRR